MKALFVGLGSIGQRHLRNLLQIRPQIKVSAVRSTRTVPVLSDQNKVVPGASMADHYGVIEYESLDIALKNKPDLVFVTNPSSMHLEIASLAMKTGAHVFIEKPLSHEWAGVEALAQAENDSGQTRIAVGYQFRFHPVMKFVYSLLMQNRIGLLMGARLVNGEYMPGWHPYEDYRNSYAARRELGGGALVTQIHDFDYALWFFGLPTQVFTVGGHLSSLDIDVEDSTQTLLSFENNGRIIPVSIALDYLQWPPSRGFSIVGEHGRIDCDLINNVVTVSDRLLGKSERHEFPHLIRNDVFVEELCNFLDFAAGKSEPAVGLRGGMASLKVALAARDSLQSREVVKLDWS